MHLSNSRMHVHVHASDTMKPVLFSLNNDLYCPYVGLGRAMPTAATDMTDSGVDTMAGTSKILVVGVHTQTCSVIQLELSEDCSV